MDLDLYMDIFVHRRDLFAQQQPNGAYYPVKRPLTSEDIEEHLAGYSSYGTYVVDTDNTVKYVVFDLDTQEPDAKEYLEYCVGYAVSELGASHKCLLLEYSGRKGWHVWLFLDSPLPAAQVRAWVNSQFMPGWVNHVWLDGWKKAFNGGTNWPLEVFPKQDSVEPGGFGNLVKLPHGRHAVSGGWSSFVSVPGWATGLEDVVPLPAELVPQAPDASSSGSRERRGGYAQVGGVATATPFPCVSRIIADGLEKGTRDRGFFHLALYCASHGLPQDMAEDWCLRVNDLGDPLPEREIRTKVKSAYSGRYEGARCGTDWLRDFCPAAGTPECKGWSVGRGAPVNERFAYLQ